jgi:sulfite exporter TauE/SafE/copper chaperone CopZ
MSNQLKKHIVPIKGMHCRSCELLVEEKLMKVSGVKRCDVDYKRGRAEISYLGVAPEERALRQAITQAGYEIGETAKTSFFSADRQDYKDLLAVIFYVLAGYWILKALGFTGLNFNIASNPSSLGVVILVGLVAGFSSCMALVGGLVLGLSAKHATKHPEASTAQKFKPHLYFNAGRIGGYAVLGGVLGSAGSFLQLSGNALGLMTILVGAVMLIIGLQLIGIFPRLNSWKLTLPKGIAKMLGADKAKAEYSHRNSSLMGALTFFLPCGFTQAMQLYAISTGDFTKGAAIMGLFALGTAPGLLSVGGLSSIFRGGAAKKFFKFAGVIVIFLALFNFSNGLALAGWAWDSGDTAGTQQANDPNVTLVDGVQVVKMKEVYAGYRPNKFTIQKGVPVRWEIDAQAPYSCAASIVVSKLNIRKNLQAGLNVIEFTPKETGKIAFSCSMGMYTGSFNVVDGSAKNTGNDNSEADNSDNNSGGLAANTRPSGGGCGGGGCGGCGGGKRFVPDAAPTEPETDSAAGEQIIKTIYTAANFLSPNSFKVKAGVPVKLEIDVRDSGKGCGYAITIPGLYDDAIPLVAGQPITMEFTPDSTGDFDITCGMGMIRFGSITAE